MKVGNKPVCERNMIWFQPMPETKEEKIKRKVDEVLNLLDGLISDGNQDNGCKDILEEIKGLL